MTAVTTTPAPEVKPVTLQEGWELCAADLSTAYTLRDHYATKAKRARALKRDDDVALDQRTADAWARRCAVLEKLCGLIDLALNDPETLERLKARAAEKKAAATNGGTDV